MGHQVLKHDNDSGSGISIGLVKREVIATILLRLRKDVEKGGGNEHRSCSTASKEEIEALRSLLLVQITCSVIFCTKTIKRLADVAVARRRRRRPLRGQHSISVERLL